MIRSKKELKKYIKCDYIMNHGEYSLKKRVRVFFSYDLIAKQLKYLRKAEYYSGKKSLFSALYRRKLKKLSYKTGITIPLNVFGYGLVIPHHGTIVVGDGNKIGNYCVLHTSTCITAGNKQIGDFFYLSAGAKVLKDIVVADGVSVSANSVLNKNADVTNSLYAGAPAKFIKNCYNWINRDGEEYQRRYEKCESIMKK